MMSDQISREILLAFWKVHILHHAQERPIYGRVDVQRREDSHAAEEASRRAAPRGRAGGSANEAALKTPS